jgi:hypothetical protein
MQTADAARRWGQTWARAWPSKDVDAIASLYSDSAVYRSHPFTDPEPGGARAYLRRQFALEQDVSCRFGEPIAGDDRAAVEWWASWVEDGETVALAGATVLRFAADGRVVEHVDYWVQGDVQREPFPGWGSSSP